MPTQFSTVDNVDALFAQFQEGENIQEQNIPQETSPVQELFNPQPTEQKSEEEKKEVDVQAELDKVEQNKQVEEDKYHVKDVSKFASFLKDKLILDEYEDGTLPEKEEELIDALSQSVETRTAKRIEEAWKEKVESLPENLIRIHEYAAQGVTTAQELNQFINAVAQQEVVGSLDPKNPEHQEQIVLLQLLNTGIDQKTAEDEVADLKERNKLEARASQYFPTLKKAYDDNVRQIEVDKKKGEEELQRYIQTNATNVAYFLEKDTEYLPFKFASNDKLYKQQIAQLGSQVTEITPDGSPVFGWQKQMEALQYGSEADYKKYMKAIAFIANMDKYEENISKKASSVTNSQNFKKIKDTTGKSTNTNSTEVQPIAQQRQQPTKGWSLV